jgi:steroid delta-isomerase-like uncharacterized protein
METGMAITEQYASPSEQISTVFECLNNHDAEGAVQFGAEDEMTHWPAVGPVEGRNAVRDYFASTFASFPDFHIEIERMVSEDETVFVHWHITGTFTGEALRGVPATGRPLDIRETDYFTVRDGKIVSVFIAYDGLDFAGQLGLLAAAGAPPDQT